MNKIFNGLMVFLVIAFLNGCSIGKDSDKISSTYQGMTAEQLFQSGEVSLAKRDYSTAAKQFEALEAQYPFGKYAEQAQLDIIYAYLKSDQQASAVAAADRFIHLYPRSKFVDYAYYMRGVAHFEQDRGILAKYLPIDLSRRDVGAGREAFEDFKTLLQLFPDSRYAPDARKRLVYLRNQLAKNELSIAYYYMEQHAYVAAANRASYLIENYSQAPQAKKALIYLVQANRALGLNEAADRADQVLKHNYGITAPAKFNG